MYTVTVPSLSVGAATSKKHSKILSGKGLIETNQLSIKIKIHESPLCKAFTLISSPFRALITEAKGKLRATQPAAMIVLLKPLPIRSALASYWPGEEVGRHRKGHVKGVTFDRSAIVSNRIKAKKIM